METERDVAVALDRDTVLQGWLTVPGEAVGLVVLTEGEGQGRAAAELAPLVAPLREVGLATLRLDLLTTREEAGRRARSLCFNTGLLAMRLMRVTLWASRNLQTRRLPVAYLGAGAGGEAALKAVSLDARCARAVVAWNPPLQVGADVLGRVRTPALLLTGEGERAILTASREALAHLQGMAELARVPDEPLTAHAHVAARAAAWLRLHLAGHREAARATL